MRVIGINPESILNQHVIDSNVPGESYHSGAHCDESDHSESHGSMDGFHFDDNSSEFGDKGGFELAKWLILIPGSNTYAMWRFIFITSCLMSPYFYAWISLHGHGDLNESQEILTAVIVFECIFAMNILIGFITAYYPEGQQFPVV